MAVSPQSSMQDRPADFRAPPPSPVAPGRRSCVTNDDVLTEFLQTSLRVPDLILPDKIFPKQKFIENPSLIDFQSLRNDSRSDCASRMLDSIARVGCFQLVNFGIPPELLLGTIDAAGEVFDVSQEGKAAVTRSAERFFGFEDAQGEEESELAEEFVWCADEGLNLDLERVWPKGYSNFSERMIRLSSEVEKVAEMIFAALRENSPKLLAEDNPKGQEDCSLVCSILKHRRSFTADQRASSLRYDIIKMMIRGADYSHALCLHMWNGASEFHVYSKKGWVSFRPEKDCLIVTAGDRFQALSKGQYKHVIGRPVFEGEGEDRVSIGFLYTQRLQLETCKDEQGDPRITIGQQIMVALVLILVYHMVTYLFKNF